LKKIAREADFLLGQKIKPISETNHESTPPDPPKRPSHDLPGPDSDDRPPRMQLHVLHTAHRPPSRPGRQPIGTIITSLRAVKAISNVGLDVVKAVLVLRVEGHARHLALLQAGGGPMLAG
jgi:hypothetical protein